MPLPLMVQGATSYNSQTSYNHPQVKIEERNNRVNNNIVQISTPQSVMRVTQPSQQMQPIINNEPQPLPPSQPIHHKNVNAQ